MLVMSRTRYESIDRTLYARRAFLECELRSRNGFTEGSVNRRVCISKWRKHTGVNTLMDILCDFACVRHLDDEYYVLS
jgi:hypothetical protein